MKKSQLFADLDAYSSAGFKPFNSIHNKLLDVDLNKYFGDEEVETFDNQLHALQNQVSSSSLSLGNFQRFSTTS